METTENIELTYDVDPILKDYSISSDCMEIITYPHPTLKKVADKVENFGEELQSTCIKMLNTMYDAPGIGLAAPQVNISSRFLVMDINYEREELTDDEYTYTRLQPLILINPEVTEEEDQITYQEGCLSLPGIFEDVKRFKKIKVKYQNTKGEEKELIATDLLSICIQHEIDHLNGVVFIERLSTLKQNFYRKKLLKKRN